MSSEAPGARKQPTVLRRTATRNAMAGRVPLSTVKGRIGSNGKAVAVVQPPQPACDACREACTASRAVLDAYRGVFRAAKQMMLEDQEHHHRDDSSWHRLMRVLGADSTVSPGRKFTLQRDIHPGSSPVNH